MDPRQPSEIAQRCVSLRDGSGVIPAHRAMNWEQDPHSYCEGDESFSMGPISHCSMLNESGQASMEPSAVDHHPTLLLYKFIWRRVPLLTVCTILVTIKDNGIYKMLNKSTINYTELQTQFPDLGHKSALRRAHRQATLPYTSRPNAASPASTFQVMK